MAVDAQLAEDTLGLAVAMFTLTAEDQPDSADLLAQLTHSERGEDLGNVAVFFAKVLHCRGVSPESIRAVADGFLADLLT